MCTFIPLSKMECPEEAVYGNYKKCSWDMNDNDICIADQTLPDGNPSWDVKNCIVWKNRPYNESLFKCVKGNN